MNSSFELRHRYVFGIDIFDDTPLEYLDDDTVVFLNGGVVILYNTKTKGQQVIGEDPSSNFKVRSFHTVKKWILLLQTDRVDGTWRIVIVDKGNIKQRSSFNLYYCGEGSDQSSSKLKYAYQARICVTVVNEELLVAVLERRDDSNVVSLRSIDGTVLGQSTVAELNGLDNASMSFQSRGDVNGEDIDEPNAVLTVQTASSLLFYRVKHRCEGWNLNLANFPPSKMSLGISGSIIAHCSVRKRKETTVFFSSCKKLICTESGIVTCSEEVDFDIQCLVGLDDGFSAGCSDGTLRLFEIFRNEIDDHSQLSCCRIFSDLELSSTSASKLISLALAPRGNVLCVLVSEPNKLIEIDLYQDSNEVTFSPIVNVHQGSINSADTCIQAPLLATAGSDGTIRLWNYNSGKSIMVTRPFLDAPLKVSMHPSGLHMLISFADEVLLSRILVDELRIIRRMALKHCRICTFSSGGNLFSLSHDNVIHIFDFVSGDKIQVLKGHNSRVSSLIWIEGDTSIISSDEDGMIYRFDVSLGIRCQECSLYKSCVNIKFAMVDDLWVYSDENFDILSPESLSKKDNFKKEVELNGAVSHVVSSHEPSLFCIVVTKETENDIEKDVWVINVYSTPQNCVRFNIYEEVTSISLSYNDQILIACLRSGTTIVYNLTEVRESSLLMTEGPSICHQSLDEYWNDLTLVSGFVLQEKNSIFSGLGTLEQELNANHEYKCSTCKISNDEKVSELENRYRWLVNDSAARIMEIQNRASEITSRHDAMVSRQRGIFQYTSDQIQSQYQKSTQELLQELNRTKLQWDNCLRELETLRSDTILSNASSKKIFEEEAKIKLEECRNIIQDFEQNELVEVKSEHEEIIRQMENDIDDEIENIKAQNKKKLASAREKTMKASSDNGIALKRMFALQRNIEDCKDIIKMHLTREQDLQGVVSKLETSIELLKEEKRRKSDMLRIRRTAAYRLHKKKKHLNNFTSILTEKLDETKLHLPCEKGDDVKMEIEKMLQNLNDIRSEKSDIESWLSNQAMKKIAVREDIVKARKKQSKLTIKSKNFLKLIQDCIDVIQRPDELRTLIQKEHTSRVWLMKDEPKESCDRENEVLALQNELNAAKKSLRNIKSQQSGELAHAKKRNHLLLNEITKKRKELLVVRTQINRLQSKRL